jgi:putative tryptophan/tyrosine transport system substrate-binding protein
LGVQLQLLEARGPNEFDGAFAAMAKERVGALLVLSDAMLNSTEHGSQTSQPGAACRQHTASGRVWRPGASCLTGRAFSISTGGPPLRG